MSEELLRLFLRGSKPKPKVEAADGHEGRMGYCETCGREMSIEASLPDEAEQEPISSETRDSLFAKALKERNHAERRPEAIL